MAFKSLQTVLGGLQTQYSQQERHQLQRVMRCWVEVVGPVVAAQTRPLHVSRGTLKVATSSAAWAQNLVFERQRILAKLQHIAALEITDIRFSPAQWQTTPAIPSFPGEQEQHQLWLAHPSRLPKSIAPPSELPSTQTESNHQDALAAFQQWATVMRSRSRQLPLCPECQCPTPTGELHRWQVCSICAAKRW